MAQQKIGSKVVFAPGELISEEDTPGNEWYILLRGAVGVFKGGKSVDTFTDSGTIFGELSGILGVPRTATLKAIEETEVLCVAASLDELVTARPDIIKKILVSLAERLVKTTDLLVAAKS